MRFIDESESEGMGKKGKRPSDVGQQGGDGKKRKKGDSAESELSELDKQIAEDSAALDVLVGLIPAEHYRAPDPDKKVAMSAKYMKKDKTHVSSPTSGIFPLPIACRERGKHAPAPPSHFPSKLSPRRRRRHEGGGGGHRTRERARGPSYCVALSCADAAAWRSVCRNPPIRPSQH